MTKNEARFTRQAPAEVVARLLEIGLSLRNPVTGKFQAFTCKGEAASVGTEDEALRFLFGGNGLSFWLAGDHDLFVSCQDGALTASFDGFTESEEVAMISKMHSVGLRFAVANEEDVR